MEPTFVHMTYYTRGQRKALTEAIAAAREVGLRGCDSDELEDIHNSLREVGEQLRTVESQLKELITANSSSYYWYILVYTMLVIFATVCILRQTFH